MTIGFLHLGSDRGGIHRDGRILARRLGEQADVEVLECAVDVTSAGIGSMRKLIGAARVLQGADVTIVPYSPNRLWTPGRTHLVQLVLTLLVLSRTVVIVHDVYPSRPWRSRNWWALAACGLLGRAVVFHEQHEISTLSRVPRHGLLFRIPLPVEEMALPSRPHARDRLDVGESSMVLGMVGWIHPRKNCERAIHALARLPKNAHLWLVGSAPAGVESYCRKLTQLAGDLGVADRLSITGYVDDDDLRCRLAAIDVALVPYTAISASASLSTLVGARRPVVASDLAVTRELHELAPLAIRLADDPATIAQLVESIVADPPGESAFSPILSARSPESVADRFQRVCRDVMR